MTIDKVDICRRHRLPTRLAGQLVGQTPAELEADAAARAALMQMFGSTELAPEPAESTRDDQLAAPPPKDKPFQDYTSEDWAATHADAEQKARVRQQQAAEQERQRREAWEAAANMPLDVRLLADETPKLAAHREFLRHVHADE